MNIINADFIKLLNNKYQITTETEDFEKFEKMNVQYYFYRHFKNKNYKFSKQIEQKVKQNLFKNILYLDFKNYFEQKLKENNIKYFFYKGIYTMDKIYQNISDRYICDIDVLIDENDIEKLNNIKFTKFDENLFFKKHSCEEAVYIEYKGNVFGVDLHKSFVPKDKFNIIYDDFLFAGSIEIHLIALIIQCSNDVFVNVEQKLLDIYLILKKYNIDFDSVFKLAELYKIKKITYLTFYLMNKYFNFEINLQKINLNGFEKKILENMFVTNIFRINQLVLFFYTFDSTKDYIKFIKSKLSYIKKNGFNEVLLSLKKIK